MSTSNLEKLVASVIDRAMARSDVFKAGAIAALRFRALGERIAIPYALRTTDYDAFTSGVAYGHTLWRSHGEAA